MPLQPLGPGRMRWIHFRRLVCVLVLSPSSLSGYGLYKFLVAAVRDDDRGDRRGRDDFFNRCMSSISVTHLQAFNQLTLRMSSG